MVKESIEKLAREKAEKSAKQEALTVQFIADLPFVFIACIMAATGAPTVFYTIVILTGLFVALVIYLSIKSCAYEKHYANYLRELSVSMHPFFDASV